MTPHAPLSPHATIPADRLFWSVIEAPGVRAGRIPAGLWPVIEDELPVSPEQIWAVGAPIDGNRIAMCAIRKTDLIDLAAGSLTLTPAAVPDFIPATADTFNFLIGEHEPKPIRIARLRRHLAAAACTLLAVSLFAVGLSRRAGAWEREALAANAAATDVVASIAPRSAWSRDDLALELMQRQQTIPHDLAPAADAAETLASIIARWPMQVPSKPQTISATGSAASISVTVPGDAQAFLASLRPPEGWTLDEPRLAAIDKATRLNLELRKVGGEGTR